MLLIKILISKIMFLIRRYLPLELLFPNILDTVVGLKRCMSRVAGMQEAPQSTALSPSYLQTSIELLTASSYCNCAQSMLQLQANLYKRIIFISSIPKFLQSSTCYLHDLFFFDSHSFADLAGTPSSTPIFTLN